MTKLKTLFKDTQMPLPFAERIASERSDASLRKDHEYKCVSCNHKEQWYKLRICTFDAGGMYGEHSDYDVINVVEESTELNDFRIKIDADSLEEHLRNVRVNSNNIQKKIEQLDYYKSIIKNNYFLESRKTWYEKICNECLKRPNAGNIMKELNLSKYLKKDWIEVVKREY